MAKKALKMEKKWVIPVVWKFCDLDTNPDEEIDLEELIPISAPLKVQYLNTVILIPISAPLKVQYLNTVILIPFSAPLIRCSI